MKTTLNDPAPLEAAVAAYRTLLQEQLARTERLSDAAATPLAERETIVVGLIAGDGIGPLIMEPVQTVLETLLHDQLAAGRVVLRPVTGLTLENRLQLGQSVPDEVLAQIKSCDVILKGPTTTPHGGTMESANVTLRRELDLYANVRPVCVPEKQIDWTFFRENTEGEYILGSRGVELAGILACDFKVITVPGTLRIARAAFDFARANRKQRVTVVTKANIMKKTDGLFSALCHRVAADYPEIEVEDRYVDIVAADLINPDVQSRYQVFVLPNLYGDILTDEAAQLMGGVGTAGSANLGDRYAIFEPIHGSAPRLLEDGLGDYVNPASLLRAAQMLLTHASLTDAADRLARALDQTLAAVTVNGTREGRTCREFTEHLLRLL